MKERGRKLKKYVWRENLFSLAGVKDCDLKFFAFTAAEHTAAKFGAEIVDIFPTYSMGETTLILRSSHTCLPKSGVESMIYRAETEEKNLFFGAGWVLVNGEDVKKAKYLPLKAGAALLSPMDYPYVSDCIRMEIIKRLIFRGVFIESTNGVYIDAGVQIGSGAKIAHDVSVTGGSVIKSGAVIKPYTVIEDSEVGAFAEVGPFVHLRANGKIGDRARIGNFTEVKNSSLGAGTKAAHLSYVGDADLGEKCNVGCGAVFVNYNGKTKRRAKVGDKCFIGSNANVVAPVELEDGCYVAAGSTVTCDLKSGDLCIARERERILPERAKKYYNPD